MNVQTSAPVTASAPRTRENEGQQTLLWCLLALLVPRATLYGELSPFGIGLACGATALPLPLLLCLCVGYLLAQPTLLPLRYIATVAMVGGLRWVLSALPELKKRAFVPPLVGFVATAVTGLTILSRSGMDGYRALLILAEGVVAAGSGVFFRVAGDAYCRVKAHPRSVGLSPGQQAAVILTGAVVVVAAASLTVGGFSPGRAAASLLILVLARSGREAGGCMAGVILGAGLALSAPGQAVPALALAFGGLVAGLFSRFGRLSEAVAYLLAAGVVTLAEVSNTMLFAIYEILAAGVVFVLLPHSIDRKLAHLLIRSRDLPAVEGVRRMMSMRLRVAASALGEVAQSVEAASRRLAGQAPPDFAALYRNCRTEVCAACPLQAVCWEQHGEGMRTALAALTPLLQQEGEVQVEQLEGFPAQRCRRPQRLVDGINRNYARYLARESAFHRLREIQQAVEGQFAGSEELLRSLAGQLEDKGQVDIDLSARVLAVCRDYGMTVQDALCTRDGGNRLTIDILTAHGSEPPTKGRWHSELEQVCGRNFAPPVVAQWGEELRVTLSEPPRYRITSGVAQRRCDGERLCGDTADVAQLSGCAVAVLSDGMGSGGRAAVDSAMTVGITRRLWKAGYSPTGILQTVNAALQVKSREESLATLDVAVIDTHSGRLDSYKAGAAVTLLRSEGRVSRLERSSLPVGILPDIHFEHSHDCLAPGDVLLLLSDGALCDGVAPIEELLRDYPADGDMQGLAQAVVDTAYAAQTDHTDDITAVALRVEKAQE